MLLRLIIWMVSVSMCGAAHAAVIYNFGDNADSVDVFEDGEFLPQLIPLGGRLDVRGTAKIRYAGIEKTLENSAEYAIWGDGVFTVQTRKK